MLKFNRKILTPLIFITLVTASSCFAIGLILSSTPSSENFDSAGDNIPDSLPQASPQITDNKLPTSDLPSSYTQIPKKYSIKISQAIAIEPHIYELNQPIQPGNLDLNSSGINTETINSSASYPSITNSEPSIDEKTFTVPAQFQGKIIDKIGIPNQQKIIALTFDDGPWPKNTLQVLDILKKNNIKATFFWIGQCVKNYPEIAQQVIAQGHAIGNHTWSHSYRMMDNVTAAHEIDDTAEIIYNTTGVKTLFFRPPGGLLNNGVADYAKKKNYALIMWSDDPMDYRPLPAEKLVANVIRKAQSGRIVLMHDGGGNHSATIKALPEIIAKLKQQGYNFVTLPELLEIADK